MGASSERGQVIAVGRVAVTLPVRGCARPEIRGTTDVRLETEPFEVLEERRLVIRPAATTVVILEPEEHAAVECAGDPPDADGVGDVPQVQIACRAGGKTRKRSRWKSRGKGAQVEGSHGRKMVEKVVSGYRRSPSVAHHRAAYRA